MADYKYSKKVTEHMAKAVLRDAPISTKQCIEICNFIRKKSVADAKSFLSDVVAMKKAVPYKRFTSDTGHKKAIGPGRYPVKASQAILDLLESVEANANYKGMNSSSLIITHISPQKGSRPLRYGRQRGRLAKRTSVELVVEEGKETKRKPQQKKAPAEKKETKELKQEAPSQPEKKETKEVKQENKEPKKEEKTEKEQESQSKESKPKEDKKPEVAKE